MKLNELLDVLHESTDLSTDAELKAACKLIIRAQSMTGGEIDTIAAAFESGPLWDGDVPSKSARDTLTVDGFMQRVVVKGEEGFNACTYLGARLYRLGKAIREGAKHNG